MSLGFHPSHRRCPHTTRTRTGGLVLGLMISLFYKLSPHSLLSTARVSGERGFPFFFFPGRFGFCFFDWLRPSCSSICSPRRADGFDFSLRVRMSGRPCFFYFQYACIRRRAGSFFYQDLAVHFKISFSSSPFSPCSLQGGLFSYPPPSYPFEAFGTASFSPYFPVVVGMVLLSFRIGIQKAHSMFFRTTRLPGTGGSLSSSSF